MTRYGALLVSIVIGLSLAPTTSSAAPNTSSTVSVESAVGIQPFEAITADTKKKACRIMCVQSKLPSYESDAYFVNSNADLLMFRDDGFDIRDLDRRYVRQSGDLPANVTLGSFGQTAYAPDGDTVFIVANHETDGARVYRFYSDSPGFTDITPESATHDLYGPFMRDILAIPDGSGFYMLHGSTTASYVCKFSSDGLQTGCSTSFNGGSETSGLFFANNNTQLVVWGDTDKRWVFDATDLTKSVSTVSDLTGVDLDFDHGMRFSDGDVVFADAYFGGTPVPSETTFRQLTVDGGVRATTTVPYPLSVVDVVAPTDDPYFGYFFVVPFASSGTARSWNALLQIQNANSMDGLLVRRTMKVKPNRNFRLPANLTIDSLGRYVLMSAANTVTSVVPAHPDGPLRITMDSNYTVCPTIGYDITWDFLNLQSGKSVASYTVFFKALSGKKFRKIDSIPADGTRWYFYEYTGVPGYVRILPAKVKVTNYHGGITADGESAPPIPRPFTPQPAC